MDPKPCPFCGSSNVGMMAAQPKWGCVECVSCGARGPEVRTEYETSDHWRDAAVAEWNRRKE